MNRLATIASLTILAAAPVVHAQQAPQVTEEQMKAMQEYAQKMQACMANVDMQALEARASALEAEVKTLCAAGKRDEAQERATAYGMEMAQSAEMKGMRECADLSSPLLQPQPTAGVPDEVAEDVQSMHVCDSLGSDGEASP
jgi:hypothetical protein